MKGIFITLISILISLILTACFPPRPSLSYVDGTKITPNDAVILITDAVTYLEESLPPAHTILVLDHPVLGANNQVAYFKKIMVEKLRESGYGIIEDYPWLAPEKAQGTTLIRYLVSSMDNGVLLQLQYLQYEASRFYLRMEDGVLISDTPFTVRNGDSNSTLDFHSNH